MTDTVIARHQAKLARPPHAYACWPAYGYEERFEVDTDGVVYDRRDGSVVPRKNGQIAFQTQKSGLVRMKVHLLVARTFVVPPCDPLVFFTALDRFVVRFKNGDKTDLRADNLEIVARGDVLRDIHALRERRRLEARGLSSTRRTRRCRLDEPSDNPVIAAALARASRPLVKPRGGANV